MTLPVLRGLRTRRQPQPADRSHSPHLQPSPGTDAALVDDDQ
ncbi:hypothetical protein ACFWIJ_05720 [Streptomyces sp. NPDC127079]